jgi:hypothetical protein
MFRAPAGTMTTEEYAAERGVTPSALAHERRRGDGPPWFRWSKRRVLYHRAIVAEWERRRVLVATGQAGEPARRTA